MKWTPQEKYNNSYNEYGRRCKVCALFFMPQINVKMLNQDTMEVSVPDTVILQKK